MLVWRLEEQLALRRRRLFALNVVVPLALVAPVALGGAPAAHAAAVYAVLFTFFGVFGSAIPLVRDGERGLLERVMLTGFPLQRYVLDRTLSSAIIDLMQILPAAGVILAVADLGVGRIGPLALALFAALVAANAIGVLVAWAARSIAEAALFGSVVSLLLLHLSAVFRTPAPGSAWAAVEAVMPFTALHEMLLATVGISVGGADLMLRLTWAGGGAVVLLGVVTACGSLVVERLRAA